LTGIRLIAPLRSLHIHRDFGHASLVDLERGAHVAYLHASEQGLKDEKILGYPDQGIQLVADWVSRSVLLCHTSSR